MSAATLREAASVLRERAMGAVDDLHGSRSWHGIGTGYRGQIKAHIQTMSPTVSLALADWLAHAARCFGEYPDDDALATALARTVLTGKADES